MIGSCDGKCDSDGYCQGNRDQICWDVTPLSSDADLNFGTAFGEALFGGGWVGSLDEVAIYDRKLDCNEVSNVYNSSCQPAESPATGISGKYAFASSSSPAHQAVAAVDEFPTTYWESVGSDPQDFTVDLGRVRSVSTLNVNWKSRASAYDILVSDDGSQWELAKSVASDTSNADSTALNVTARYIRLHMSAPIATVFSIFSIYAIACDAAPAMCQNFYPICTVGPQQLAYPGKIVQLVGAGFDLDPQGLATDPQISYGWALSRPVGSAAVLSDIAVATPTFIADALGTYAAELTVTDVGRPGDSTYPTASSYPAATIVTVIPRNAYVNAYMAAAIDVANSLTTADVTSSGNLLSFRNLIYDANKAIEKGETDTARKKIRMAITRTDGWSLRGAPDANEPGSDWITAQEPATALFTDLSATLEAL